jgi:arylsulfatase A-like enzyme
VFTEGETYETIEQNRIWYEEYIANVYFEFGRLMDHLEGTGMLDKSYLLVTSDHGELLERGVKGHVTPLLYEPLVRVPLVISSPGQIQGMAIDSPTTSVDLLPTLLAAAGQAVPEWAPGKLLPGLGGIEEPERRIYTLEAKSAPAFGKLTQATFAMREGKYKIIMYHGYEEFGEDAFELYDLENDPEEMNDLLDQDPSLAEEFKNKLLGKFAEIDQPHDA